MSVREGRDLPSRVCCEVCHELCGLEPALGHIEEDEVPVVVGCWLELREHPAGGAVGEVPRQAGVADDYPLDPPQESSSTGWMIGDCGGKPIATDPTSMPGGGA